MNDASACPINLDRRGVRQRLVGGSVAFGLGTALALYAVLQGRGLAWRVPAVALLAFGTLALIQARAKT